MAAEPAPRDGLLVDFGGVLTTSVFDSFAAFCRAEGLDADTIRAAFRGDPVARRLLEDLETGRLDPAAFSAALGERLGLADAADLPRRLFAGLRPDPAMIDAVRRFRAAGVRTGLVSNSWGDATAYDRALPGGLFDALVISGEIGLRKPDPAIYELGARRIGVPPARCVFVDDLGGNLKPAAALGMATVRHVRAEETIAQLEALLGAPAPAEG